MKIADNKERAASVVVFAICLVVNMTFRDRPEFWITFRTTECL